MHIAQLQENSSVIWSAVKDSNISKQPYPVVKPQLNAAVQQLSDSFSRTLCLDDFYLLLW